MAGHGADRPHAQPEIGGDLLGEFDAGLRVALDVADVEIPDVDSDVVVTRDLGDIGEQARARRGDDLGRGRAQVGHQVDAPGHHDRRVGFDREPPDRRHDGLVVELLRNVVHEQDDLARGHQRVVTVGHGGGTGVGLFAENLDVQLLGVPRVVHGTQRDALTFQDAALLDVDLGVSRDLGARVTAAVADRRQGLGHRDARKVTYVEHLVLGHQAREHR